MAANARPNTQAQADLTRPYFFAHVMSIENAISLTKLDIDIRIKSVSKVGARVKIGPSK
jgi:hypothetical protein